MGQEDIKIGIKASSNGTLPQTEKEAAAVAKQLEKAAASSEKLNKSMAAGGTKGSRAVAAKAQPAGYQAMSETDYNAARGTAGVTGASARDFANQAQGLGGLVRLYATYAANLFAVSAAFRALSDAMDTTNMVKGLDQLGAATGRNLGGLSKRLVDLTDGAISFQESMKAVAQSSSAGMSSKNIERMAIVAKNASMALGVAMPDALSRLSRGITKLEPELLDELGIMTKIQPAVDAYSLQVGKAASQLTDFERRQAFANAVLKEGEDKFGKLGELAANPYDKLLAALKNLSQSILESVNKAIGPFVNLLSSSPTALTAAIGLLSIALVKKALPAIGEFKSGLAEAADKATALAVQKTKDAEDAKIKLKQFNLQRLESIADKELDAVVQAESKMNALREKGVRTSTSGYKLMQQDFTDFTEANVKNIDNLINKTIMSSKRYEAQATKIEKEGGDATKVAALREQAKVQMDIVTATRGSIAAERELEKAAGDSSKATLQQRLTIDAASKAVQESNKRTIISNAAYNASLIGVTGAWTLMKEEINKAGLNMGKFEAGAFKAKAAMAILGGAISTVGAALGSLMNWVGLIVGAFGLLDSLLSKNNKEMESFRKALDAGTGAVENMVRTVDYLNKQGGFASGTIQGINALSSALVEVASTTEATVDATTKALDTLRWYNWDGITNNIKKIWGGDILSKSAAQFGEQIESAMAGLRKTSLAGEADRKLKEVLKVTSLDAKTVEAAFASLDKMGQTNAVKVLKELNIQLGNSASILTAFKTSSDSAYKSYQEFLVSTANTSPLFKLGAGIEIMAQDMSKAVMGGADEINAAFDELAKNPQKVALFGKEFANDFVSIRKEFEAVSAASKAMADEQNSITAEIEKQNAILQKLPTGHMSEDAVAARKAIEQLNEKKRELNKAEQKLDTSVLDKARDLFMKGMNTAFDKGAELIKQALGQAQEKAALAIAKAQLGRLSGVNLAEQTAKLNQQEYALQIKAIDTNIGLIKSQEQLKATIDESNAIALDEKAAATGTIQEKENAAANLSASRVFKEILDKGLGLDKESLSAIAKEKNLSASAFAILQSKAIGPRQQLAGQEMAKVGVQGQAAAQAETDRLNTIAAQYQEVAKINALESAILQARLGSLNTLISISGVTTKVGAEEQSNLELQILQKKQALELEEIENRRIRATGDVKELKKLQEEEKLVKARQKLELNNQGALARQKLLQIEIEDIAKRYDLIKSTQDLEHIGANARLDVLAHEVNAYSGLYETVAEYGILQQNNLEKQRALSDTTLAMQQAQDGLNKSREEAEARINALKEKDPALSGTTLASIQKINDNLANQETITNNTISGLAIQYDTRLKIADITKETALQQERYNVLLKDATSIASSLKEVFGEIGDKLGGVVTAFTEVAIATEKRAKAEALAQKAVDEATSPKERADAEKALAAQKTANSKAEINDTIKTLNASKKLFAEKTFAYKVLDKAEKAMHVFKMAMWVKEVAMETWAAAMSIKSSITKSMAKSAEAGVDGVAAVVKAIASVPFPLNMVAGAVTAAAVATLLGQLGGGSKRPSAAFAMNSEQRQETQGTGMTYDSTGNKVETGSGVFGASTEKVDNINKSLEIIKNNSIDGLSYDNKMLKAFEKLSNALTGAATAIYAIPGLRQGGTGFGSMTGTTSSPGFLGSIPVVGKILGSIFGGGTSASSSIESAGIQLRGSFQQLIDDTTNSVQQYKDILTQFHEDGGWFGSDSDWTTRSRETANIGAEAAKSIKDIFIETKNMFTSIGEQAGITAATVQSVFDTMNTNIDVDLKGLTGDQIVTELNAVIGSKLDEAAKVLFSSFDQYKKFGESYLTTVVRVVDTNTKIQQVLTNMGIDVVVNRVYDITEAMATAAGGLDKFVEQYDFFKSNFLTTAEQLVPVQKAVNDELNRLHINTSINREGFVALVRSLDLTTKTGQETYQALMNLAPGIDQVFKAEEKVATERAGLQKKVLELEGDTIALRQMELDALDASNQGIQRQIWAMQDQQTAAKNLKSNLDNVTKTIKSQIQTLSDYKTSLMTGSSSTLTTTQQYQQAKSDINTLLATINTSPKTKEEEEARNTAIGKLSGATDKFLGFSRELYASGAQYTADFNTVLDIVTQTSSALDTQLTDAEKQLTTLKESNTYLQSIDASTQSTAQLIQAYLDANSALAATGYNAPKFAVGTNYVPNDMVATIHRGERIIPMADNFKLMSRLTDTDNYTRDMCQQIRELNQKIDSLERTVADGAIINAEATNRNTEQIAQAVTDSSDKAVQVNRIQNRAIIK